MNKSKTQELGGGDFVKVILIDTGYMAGLGNWFNSQNAFIQIGILVIGSILLLAVFGLFIHITRSIMEAKLFIELYPILDAIDDDAIDLDNIENYSEEELDEIIEKYKQKAEISLKK